MGSSVSPDWLQCIAPIRQVCNGELSYDGLTTSFDGLILSASDFEKIEACLALVMSCKLFTVSYMMV